MFGVPIPIDSSTIQSVRWDAESRELEVSFKPRGRDTSPTIYVYSNINLDVLNGLLIAESKGRYFHSTIKSRPEKFPFRKVDRVSETTETGS